MDFRLLLRSLTHRNFRLYFLGQGVSLVGTWMQQVAIAWLVLLLTHGDPFRMGLVAFAGQVPAFFLAPVAGVVADRVNRHRLLIFTQSVALLQALALAGLTYAGNTLVWPVLLLNLLLGVVNAFDMTARQSLLTELVTRREDLANAIALNSSMVNGARLVGPALAGVALTWLGPAACFLANALSFLAVLAALLAMDVPPRKVTVPHAGVLRGLAEGFAYAFGFHPIRALLLLLALVSLVNAAYVVLLPLIATERLQGGAETLALLTAAQGVGALTGALFLAARRTVLGLGKWIAAAPALLGVALLGFASSERIWLSCVLLAAAGFAVMVQMAATNTLLQTITDEHLRGRVMSFYTMAFLGVAPVGSLAAGLVAGWLGTAVTIRAAGVLCLVGACAFGLTLPRLRERVRPIYRKLGILPQIASGIGAATELSGPPEPAA
jgi:MFS family permease